MAEKDPFAEFGSPLEEEEDEFAEFGAPIRDLPIDRREQGVSFLERRMLSGDADTGDKIAYLQGRGYIAEEDKETGALKVRKPEDKSWKVVDPIGIQSIGDAFHSVLDVAKGEVAGVPLGAAGGAVAGKAAQLAVKAAPKVAEKLPSVRIAKGLWSRIKGLLDEAPTVSKSGKVTEKVVQKADEAVEAAAKKMSDAERRALQETRLQARESRLQEQAARKRPKSFAEQIMETEPQRLQRQAFDKQFK